MKKPQLVEYKNLFGNCRVPQRYSTNAKLGQWVSNQRVQYKLSQEGKSCVMTEERIQQLESVGFVWNAQASWKERFEELVEYKKVFGDCRVPTQFSDNPKLGQWVVTQRVQCKLSQEGKSCRMTEERIKELGSIGFVWSAQHASWKERFEELVEYKKVFGNCRVPKQFSNNPKLGQWVSNQRHTYKLYQKGKSCRMTEERIRELESVGFEWSVNKLL